MQTHIETWIIEQKFSRQVGQLFDESIICFKHGAYRASLLFSYLAFITHIKEILIKSNNPNPTNPGRWTNIQNEIQDDDKWEKRVFEELTNSSNPIFDIKEDLRQQIKYWKDRRNDCAHFKNNEIEYHTIETFWSFLKSNINKITVEGGKASLINKFEKHFDPTQTPPNKNFDHLVIEIHSAIDIAEFDSFIDELNNILDPYGFQEYDILRIYNKIFELCSDQFKEKLALYIKSKNLDIEFLSKYPDKVGEFGYSDSDVRKMWKTRLFKPNDKMFVFEIYSILIRNGLIPQDQLGEAFTQLFDKYEQTSHHIPTDMLIKTSLINPVLGDIIYKKAIVENDLSSFMWVNSKCDFIAFYIENFPLKKETIESVCKMVTRSNYSYWLEEKIKSLFSENPTLKNDFNSIATQNGINVPTQFQ